MRLANAIDQRISIRTYISRPISSQQQVQLGKVIQSCNKRSGLSIRLICDQPKPFDSFAKSYGMLKGVEHFLLFAGPADDPHLEEKCGYFGEEVILSATAMGLGTCWVGGTYSKKFCEQFVPVGCKLICVASIGHFSQERTFREKMLRRMARRSCKSVEQLAPGADKSLPRWFIGGMRAVQKAPSAVNRQGYQFIAQPNGTVKAHSTAVGPFAMVDLGIAKLHFELGAHGGTWTWGSGGIFRKAAEEKSCGAVIWREKDGVREYLLAQHRGGHWSFPKGHVEAEETEEQTARREIWEETGLSATVDTSFRQVVTYSPKRGVIKDVIFFLATVDEGTEKAQEEEIAQLRWFTFRDARSQVTFATDEEVLLAAEQHLSQR